jgi:branched-chain amino acid aminotransferase
VALINSNPDPIVWLNGQFVSASQAAVSPFDRGFLYGDGLFETMRSQNGRVLFLDDHLQRLNTSLRTLRIQLFPYAWQELIDELLSRNHLANEIASVKIIVTRGVCQGLGLPESKLPTICLTAHAYQPPAEEIYKRGWRLQVFGNGFSPPLAKFKSLNYLFFLAARQAALESGADEALILDPHGSVTETSTGSILARTGKTWWTPASKYQLPGITISRLTWILAAKGETVQRLESTLEDLLSAETVWVLNSLLGIMPVYEIAGQTKDPAAEAAAKLRYSFFFSSPTA